MLLFFLSACTDPSVGLLSGFELGWQGFNHRVSHIQAHVVVTDQKGFINAAVVGGTSTTGISPDLDEACDPEGCQEFPFVDTADLVVSYTDLSAPGLRWRAGSVTLDVGAEGTSAPVKLDWDTPPESFVPVIAGFTLDTTGNEGGCYDPSFGWLPTRLAIGVEPDGADVTVSATFAVGLSLEAERVCLDEAAAGAGARITVDVLGIAGLESTAETFSQSAAWNEDGSDYAEQLPPEPVVLDYPLPVAFQSFDFRFHVDDPEGRGAYLRTLTLGVDGRASATNYSPGTQLSGFDYAFDGTVVGFPGATLVAHQVVGEYTPKLAGDGRVTPFQMGIVEAIPE